MKKKLSGSRFPGFKECMRLMHQHNPQLQEEGFHLLLPHTHEHVQELIHEFYGETDPGLHYWLLELIAEAKEPSTLNFFIECFHSHDYSVKSGGILGLKKLNTKEARRFLWEAGV